MSLKFKDKVYSLLILLLAVFFSTIGLTDYAYLNNEALSIATAYEPFSSFFHSWKSPYAEPDQSFLYYYLIRFLDLFSHNIAWLRSLSALSYILCAYIFFKFIKLRTNSDTAFLSSLLLITNTRMIFFSQYIIFYSFSVFLVTALYYQIEQKKLLKDSTYHENNIVYLSLALTVTNLMSVIILLPIWLFIYKEKIISKSKVLFFLGSQTILFFTKYLYALRFRFLEREHNNFTFNSDAGYVLQEVFYYGQDQLSDILFIILLFALLIISIRKLFTFSIEHIDLSYIFIITSYVFIHHVYTIPESVSRYYLIGIPAILSLFSDQLQKLSKNVSIAITIILVMAQLSHYQENLTLGSESHHKKVISIPLKNKTVYTNSTFAYEHFAHYIAQREGKLIPNAAQELPYQDFININKSDIIFIDFLAESDHAQILGKSNIKFLSISPKISTIKKLKKNKNMVNKSVSTLQELILLIISYKPKDIKVVLNEDYIHSSQRCQFTNDTLILPYGKRLYIHEQTLSLSTACYLDRIYRYIRPQKFKRQNKVILLNLLDILKVVDPSYGENINYFYGSGKISIKDLRKKIEGND